VLCGSEDEEVPFRNSVYPSGISEGEFEFHVLTPNSKKSRKLYDQVSYDVRRVSPSVSPDGQFIVFTSRKNMARGTMMVLPLDGGRAMRVTEHYLYEWPVWGPQ
jgi:Tol biopolymer transport system component